MGAGLHSAPYVNLRSYTASAIDGEVRVAFSVIVFRIPPGRLADLGR